MTTTSETHRLLLAVLLNPPGKTTGLRTRKAVEAAGDQLGFVATEIVNLTGLATPTVLELNGHGSAGWFDARVDVAAALERASGLLAGWGISGLTGAAREARAEQANWLVRTACAAGHSEIWTVGGLPRHPSRWHQYVADKHGRTTGGSFSQRLSQVLVAVPLAADDLAR